MVQEQIKPNKQEQGRSMTEMLGVLAIIGILSIGGIMGYQNAMDKNKANDIIDGVSKRAMILSQSSLLGKEVEEDSLDADFGSDRKIAGYDLTLTGYSLEEGYDIKVSDIPQSVCEKMLDQGLKMAMAIKLDEDTIWENEELIEEDYNCAETNDITYEFSGTEREPEDPDEEERENCRYSPCLTCVKNDAGKVVSRGFVPSGTICDTSGIAGKCDGKGACVPDGQSCSSVNGCTETGYFCNYGGTKSPNKCEKARPRTVKIEGITYYYNSLTDLKSWCRPADGGNNCTWGYLSLYAAQSWCSAIGKRLLTLAEYRAVSPTLGPVLPAPIGNTYWVQEGAVNRTNPVDAWGGRPDGYAAGSGVVCK